MKSGMPLGKRLALGFGLLVAVLALVGVWSVYGISNIVGNATEVIQGNKLKASLVAREVDHLQWAESVSLLISDDTVNELHVETDPTQCALGQWYYGAGREEAEALLPSLGPLFDKLEDPHNRLHHSAVEISEAFAQPVPGLGSKLAALEVSHLAWSETLAEALAHEAGGLYRYTHQMRTVVGQAISSIEGMDAAQAAAFIARIRYGPKGDDYLFVLDADNLVMEVHPNASLVGTSVRDTTDAHGKLLFQEMARIVNESGQGYVFYWWPRANGAEPLPKISHVRLYEPLNWIVATGVYLDETDEELLARAEGFADGEPFESPVALDSTACGLGTWLSDPQTKALAVPILRCRSISMPSARLMTRCMRVPRPSATPLPSSTWKQPLIPTAIKPRHRSRPCEKSCIA